MNVIDVMDRTGRNQREVPYVRSVMQKAIGSLRLKDVEVSVNLVNDPTIRHLNRTYRKKDRPTDVLSFGLRTQKYRAPGPLGDIVISVTTARKQSRETGHSLRNELALLCVHGLLHLLGYDHALPQDERRMFRLQNRVLKDVR